MLSKKLVVFAVVVVLLSAALTLFVLNRSVNRALDSPTSDETPIELIPVADRSPLPFWGSEDVESVVALPGGLYAAGAFGVARLESAPDSRAAGLDRRDISLPLPTRRAAVLSAWRTELVAGLELEGLFLYRDGSWFEIRTGFGTLHVRDLVETPAGELWIGAREGLFRLGLAERSIARLHKFPVRTLALGEGGRVVSGGEEGLRVTQGDVTTARATEPAEPKWVEDVAVFGGRIHAVTPAGLLVEGQDGVLRKAVNGDAVASILVQGDSLFATTDPPDSSLRRFDGSGRMQVERLPSTVRRLFSVEDRLVADTEQGLLEKSGTGWNLFSRRLQPQGFGHAHVGALGAYRDRLMVGFFDGGLAELVPSPSDAAPGVTSSTPGGARMTLRPVEAASQGSVWAVNALLDAGGALHIASLRGAFRYDGSRLTPIEGAGAAFSLARTAGGVAIGYGEGVLLPERKLLSAFHGLPGNQATALATAGDGLLVGTPSGLGFVQGATVRWRAASGEGKLPHPWVTAILPQKDSVLIATYGGGVTRRIGAMTDAGEWRPFPETQGLKINTGCLVQAAGRVFAGSDGQGLFRLSVDGTRFERLKLSLPSPRVTALFEWGGFLYIGTDEGLTRWPVEGDEKP